MPGARSGGRPLIPEAGGFVVDAAEQRWLEAALAPARAALGRRFDEVAAEGEAMGTAEALALGLTDV